MRVLFLDIDGVLNSVVENDKTLCGRKCSDVNCYGDFAPPRADDEQLCRACRSASIPRNCAGTAR